MSLFQKYLATVKKYLGKRVDFDGQWNNQCVDWLKQYASSIGYPITTYGNATDFITKGLGKNWDRVMGDIWVADIGITPARKGLPYGHIYVVEKVEGITLSVIEQNRDGNAYRNNDYKNFGSPVARGKYILRGDEVFYRVKP